ncbi:iron response transcriptional regulator IrrA [Aquibaculum arenosum]|nr:Fur family transcriptional regulator [Fodinicurvata sp. CAU 1616]
MSTMRPYSGLIDRLKAVGLRPTRQRLALSRLLFEEDGSADRHRHVTAEQLHGEALDGGIRVSLATIYNTLNQFTRAGLLREVVVEPGRSYYDTNVDDHHHFYFEGSGRLLDIPGESVHLDRLPEAPEGSSVRRVDVIIRLSDEG